MKKLILIILASIGLTGAQAQLFSPDALGGALLGTMIGGVAGGNCHDGFSGSGAAIGAGVGLAAGAILGEVRRQDYYASQPYGYYPASVVYAQPGYGCVYPPAYAAAPAYVAPPPRPNYAVSGTLVGALAGGLIGTGYHQGWEDAGIGAASGLVLGSVAEVAAQAHEQKWAAAQIPPPPAAQAVPAGAPVQPTATPAQPAPNAYWAASAPASVHQIPDAPRVPDAPTF